MEKFINIDGKIYSLKFGTKSLMMLNEFSSNIDKQELMKFKFFLAVQHNDDSLTLEDTNNMIEKVSNVEQLLEDVLEDSLSSSNKNIRYSFEEQIEELYRKAVGEMGIAPQIFYDMTPREIELAYKGYLDRKQLETNCMLIAFRKSKDSKADLVTLVGGDGYKESTIAERNSTFNALGI